jgi:tRNA (cytidine/uridine-2'-O-)-methyltransferase
VSTQPSERVVPLEESQDAPLHIVLVEPQIPPNTGNVARLCAATGCALHLVEPLGFSIHDRDLKRAGLDYWPSIDLVMHASLDAFFATWDVQKLWLISTRGEHPYADAPFALGDALVFGRETSGLPSPVLAAYGARTLRLSTSVGIVAYAALRCLGFPGLQ